MKKYFLLASIFLASSAFAGQWLPESAVTQTEARDGSWFSVILSNTDSLCPSNRVIFRNGTWLNQEGVNHHYSMILAATMAQKNISIHVEIENSECIGRISVVKP
ncbi:DUF5992 family protein [Agaribacter flavus]|uniref:DUF5992 family protein n=1 Tax=Agaribacter flavus TaxID=1902781 RepID=A0ABV7FQI2_9ALTE